MAATASDEVRRERRWAIALTLLALLPRLGWVAPAPTAPTSDFRNLLDFALALRDGHPSAGYWADFNPGMPALLSLLLHLPARPEAVARFSTAIAGALLPLIAFVLLRGALSLRARVAAGLLLALWPAQLFFCGLPAQDNWLLLPTVALAALAVRALRLPHAARPIASAALFAGAIAIRQEALVTLAPLFLVAAAGGGATAWRSRARGLLIAAVSAALLVAALAGVRARVTGRFSLTTANAALAVAGSFAPGAAGDWIEPGPFLAGRDPTLLDDPPHAISSSEAWRAALSEARRRPGFHALRMTSATLIALGAPDALYWSLQADGALPPDHGARRFVAVWPLVGGSQLLLHAAFCVALFLGLRRRDPAIALLGLAVAAKVLLHTATAALGRHLLPAAALELLAIAITVEEWRAMPRRARAGALAATALFAALLTVAARTSKEWVAAHDPDMRGARFILTDGADRDAITCTLRDGRAFFHRIGFRPLRYRSIELRLSAQHAALACRTLTARPATLEVVEPAGFDGRITVGGKPAFDRALHAAALSEFALDPTSPFTVELSAPAPRAAGPTIYIKE